MFFISNVDSISIVVELTSYARPEVFASNTARSSGCTAVSALAPCARVATPSVICASRAVRSAAVALVAIDAVMVDAKFASSPRAAASSLRVSSEAGAASTTLATSAVIAEFISAVVEYGVKSVAGIAEIAAVLAAVSTAIAESISTVVEYPERSTPATPEST